MTEERIEYDALPFDYDPDAADRDPSHTCERCRHYPACDAEVPDCDAWDEPYNVDDLNAHYAEPEQQEWLNAPMGAPSVLEALHAANARVAELERENERVSRLRADAEDKAAELRHYLSCETKWRQDLQERLRKAEKFRGVLVDKEYHDRRIAELEAQLAARDGRRCGTCAEWTPCDCTDGEYEHGDCEWWDIIPEPKFYCGAWRAREVSA